MHPALHTSAHCRGWRPGTRSSTNPVPVVPRACAAQSGAHGPPGHDSSASARAGCRGRCGGRASARTRRCSAATGAGLAWHGWCPGRCFRELSCGPFPNQTCCPGQWPGGQQGCRQPVCRSVPPACASRRYRVPSGHTRRATTVTGWKQCSTGRHRVA